VYPDFIVKFLANPGGIRGGGPGFSEIGNLTRGVWVAMIEEINIGGMLVG